MTAVLVCFLLHVPVTLTVASVGERQGRYCSVLHPDSYCSDRCKTGNSVTEDGSGFPDSTEVTAERYITKHAERMCLSARSGQAGRNTMEHVACVARE